MIDELVICQYYASVLSRLHGKTAVHRVSLFRCESVDLPHVGLHFLFITSALLIGMTCNIPFPRTPIGS
jgi:hypothetical protein